MSSSEPNPKIIDLISKKEAGSKPFVSIEFFPPRTDVGVKVSNEKDDRANDWLTFWHTTRCSLDEAMGAYPLWMAILDLPRENVASVCLGQYGFNVSLLSFCRCPNFVFQNLYARMQRMKESISPLFSDVTWGAGGSSADLTQEIAAHLKEVSCQNRMLWYVV